MQAVGHQPADVLPPADEVRRDGPLMAKQLKEMEKQNSRLKKLVADQALDIQILKEAARPNL